MARPTRSLTRACTRMVTKGSDCRHRRGSAAPTPQLKEGVTKAQFEQVEREVEQTYIRKRAGFLSRESAPGSDRSWLAIVHWRSTARCRSFNDGLSTAPAAAKLRGGARPDSPEHRILTTVHQMAGKDGRMLSEESDDGVHPLGAVTSVAAQE